MHSPLEIAKNFIEIGIHKVRMSALKMLALGIFAGIYIAFAGIASTTSSATIQNASVARLVSACVFPAGMAMVLIAGSELFTGNNLIIIAVLQKKITWLQMLKNWIMVFLGNFIGASFCGSDGGLCRSSRTVRRCTGRKDGSCRTFPCEPVLWRSFCAWCAL